MQISGREIFATEQVVQIVVVVDGLGLDTKMMVGFNVARDALTKHSATELVTSIYATSLGRSKMIRTIICQIPKLCSTLVATVRIARGE